MTFEQRLQDSLEALPGGFKVHVHQVACQPSKHQLYVNREPATHVQRLILVRLEDERLDAFVCGLEVDEYTLEDKETKERVVYIAKVDTTGAFSKQRGNVTRRLLEAYLASVAPCSVYVFARSQPQYLFHLSANNQDKRVLDDRGLIRWWRGVLTKCLQNAQSSNHDNKNGIAWWHVPGVDNVSMLERQVNCSPDPNWIYGFPFDPNARAVDVIPRFSDDVKARVLKDHDDNGEMTVAALTQLLEFTEECGGNHFAGLLGIHLPAFGDVNGNDDSGSSSSSELYHDPDIFTVFWNHLMKTSFKHSQAVIKGTSMLCDKWKSLGLPKPITITTTGPTIQTTSSTSTTAPHVNTLSSNMIKRSTSSATPINTLTVKRKDNTTTPTTSQQPINTLTVKRKDTSTTKDQPINTLTVKRKDKITTTDPPINTLTVKRNNTNTTTTNQPMKRTRDEDNNNKDFTVQQLSIESSQPEPKRRRYESPTATSSSSITANQQDNDPEPPTARSFFGYLKSFFM